MVEDGETATQGVYGTTGAGIKHPAWNDGLSASAYNSANEGSSSVYNFPAADQDTDASAIAGSYTGVYDNGNKDATVTATPTNPVGYCLVESTDNNNTD
jgi:hypothetical protein